MIFAIAATAWYGFGVFSHVYWWTKKHDYTTGDVGISILSGILGPANWWIGWMVCGEASKERIIMRRRPQSPQEGETLP